MASILKYTPSIAITGDVSSSPSLGTHSYISQDVSDYGTVILKNDAVKQRVDMGNADYYSFVHLTTDNPISVYVNSSANTAIPCENVMALSGGVDDITELWVSNAGSSMATIKLVYSGQLSP